MIQKPHMFRQFSLTDFIAAPKPSPLTGARFKMWQIKTIKWITTMNVYTVSASTSRGPLTPQQNKSSSKTTVIFVGVIICIYGTPKNCGMQNPSSELGTTRVYTFISMWYEWCVDTRQKEYFMTFIDDSFFFLWTFIDDSTRYCYVYLLKLKMTL